MVRIVLNGTFLVVDYDELTYEQLIAFAGFIGSPSVTYAKGVPEKPCGILTPHNTISIVNNMVFNVASTNAA
jgi:hypothetical protein